jgi:hypothetical protein
VGSAKQISLCRIGVLNRHWRHLKATDIISMPDCWEYPFEGGFLGPDNISVYYRSKPLPSSYRLKQADATGWMAMFALNMTMMALELTVAGRATTGI